MSSLTPTESLVLVEEKSDETTFRVTKKKVFAIKGPRTFQTFSIGVLPVWTCELNPKDLGNVPPGVPH